MGYQSGQHTDSVQCVPRRLLAAFSFALRVALSSPRVSASVFGNSFFRSCFRRSLLSRRSFRAAGSRGDTLMRWRALLGPGSSPFVFPSPRIPGTHITDYKKAWQMAAKNAGLADRRTHDLRATFASRAKACHASGLTVAHLLGHASSQILPTYVKPIDENTRALIDALDADRSSHTARQGFIHQYPGNARRRAP